LRVLRLKMRHLVAVCESWECAIVCQGFGSPRVLLLFTCSIHSLCQVVRANQEKEYSPRWGVPRSYKAVVVSLILLPKLLVAAMTCAFGSRTCLRFRIQISFQMCVLSTCGRAFKSCCVCGRWVIGTGVIVLSETNSDMIRT
jgi:hypothetical protein